MWLILLQVVISLVIGAIIILYAKQLIEARKSNIPGPFAYPFFGNALEFGSSQTDITKNVIRMRREYGKICRIWLGPIMKMLLVSDPRFVDKLMTSSVNITKSGLYNYLHPWLGTGLLTSTGDKWHKRRKILTPAFHFTILQEAIETFHHASDVLIKQLEKKCDEKEFDVYPFITLYALDVICETAMGQQIHAQTKSDSAYVQAVRNSCVTLFERFFSVIGKVDFLYYNFTSNGKLYLDSVNIMHEMTDKIIQERREILKNSETMNKNESKKSLFLDALLTATTYDGKYLNDMDIREEVDTFMFEGHDTVSSALSFTLYSLATNPDAQDKLYAEIKNAFGDDKTRVPTIPELNDLKYLDMVIKETLRLYPSVPMIARTLTQDIEIDGVTMDVGSEVTLFLYDMQRDPEHFPDPNEFKPERWAESPKNNFTYVPFSAGPRNCIGQRFANLELKLTILKLIQNFEFLSPGPGFDLQLVLAIVLKSINGIHLKLKKR